MTDPRTVEALLAEFIERRLAGAAGLTAESLAPDDPELAAALAERVLLYRQVESLLGGAPAAAAGERVGRYRVEGRLGRGGMGEVFRAHDAELDRPVALKFLNVGRDGGDVVRRRLLREARATAGLDHPNLCPVYEVADAGDGRLFLAMALVEGESLAERLERGPLPPSEILAVARQAAAGLAVAHRRGVVHRDVKPANLMLGPGGTVKLLDFGLAQCDGQEGRSLEGLRPGTLAYMAPEQVRGEAVDPRSDVWALGVVLVEMASGRSPFAGPTPEATLYSIAHRGPTGLEALPAALRRVARRALRRRPEERFADAGELLAALPAEAGRAVLPSAARHLVRRLGRRRGVGLGAAVAGAAVWLALGSGSAGPWQRVRSLGPPRPDDAAPLAELKATIESRVAAREQDPGGPVIAVLPFESPGPAAEGHVAAALTHLVRSDLAKLGGLRGVTSAPARRRGELPAGFVVEGAVATNGDRTRVDVRLAGPASAERLWSERFDVALAELPGLAATIARAVSDRIGVRRTAEEEERLGAAPAAALPSAASGAYLRGLDLAGRARALGPDYFELLRAAEAQFLRAVELAPGWAAAWGELAGIEQQLGDMLDDPGSRSTARRRAREYAARALALDSGVAVAHRAMAAVRVWALDLVGAEREHLEALRLEPHTDAGGYGLVLGSGGRYVEAVRWLRHARELNPSDPRIGYWIGLYSLCGGDLSAAQAQAEALRGAEGHAALAALLSSGLAERRGEFDRAVALLEENRDALMPNFATSFHRRLAYALAKAGRRDDAIDVAEVVARRWGSPPDPNLLIALGDPDAALRRVESYYAQRSMVAVGAACWPEIDRLMEMPAAARMLRELNRPGAL